MLALEQSAEKLTFQREGGGSSDRSDPPLATGLVLTPLGRVVSERLLHRLYLFRYITI